MTVENRLPQPTEVDMSEVPPVAIEVLADDCRRTSIDSDFALEGDRALVYDFGEDKTFAFPLSFLHKGRVGSEEIALFDISNDGTSEGWGYIHSTGTRANPSIRPIVGWTETYGHDQHRGLGIRRLRLMNELSQLRYGMPLSSAEMIEDEARNLWLRLVEQGEAEIVDDPNSGKYRFVA